jgi:hypothetical protein
VCRGRCLDLSRGVGFGGMRCRGRKCLGGAWLLVASMNLLSVRGCEGEKEGTDALFKWYSAEVEVPCYSIIVSRNSMGDGGSVPSGIGREAVMVEDYFSALIHCVYCFDAGVQTQLIEADWNTVKT